jgi:integrase
LGTVAERPRKRSGTWHAYLPPSMTDGKRVRVPGMWRSEAEARIALVDYIADVHSERREIPAVAAPVHLAQAVERYIEYRSTAARGRWAAATEQGYRAVLDACVKHPRANIGALTLSRVTAPVINQWYEDLARAGVAASRIRYGRWLLSGTFKWLITRGEFVGANPVGQVASFWSKSDADEDSQSRLVLLPTWAELATLIATPKFEQDQVLIALLAWSGLRWTEATSLRCSDVWPDRPMLTVARVLVWKQGRKAGFARADRSGSPAFDGRLKGAWLEEPVKGGQRATIPLPTPLWQALQRLAHLRSTQSDCPSPAGDLLFRGHRWQQSPDRIGIINNRNWTRDAWVPARTAAGLVGDASRPELDPRRNPILIKDLRAFTASILHDAGATDLEASAMLRHRDTRTTEKYYARAMSERAHDPDRAKLRLKPELSLPTRVEELWRIWAAKHSQAAAHVSQSFGGTAAEGQQFVHPASEA